MIRFKLVLTMCVILGISNCMSASMGLNDSNIPLTGRNYAILATDTAVETSWSLDLGFIGLPLQAPPIQVLEQKLLQKHKADALVHMQWRYDQMIFLFAVVRQKLVLQAEAVRVK